MSSSTALLLTAGAGRPPRLTGDARFNRVRGHMGNLWQNTSGDPKAFIYTPVLATVYVRERQRFHDWLNILVDAGSDHVLLNVPDGDPSYGGVWQQPDLWADLDTYGEVLDALQSTRGASGYGLMPMIWMDHGGSDPMPRISERWPRFAERLRPLLSDLLWVLACEPVAGDWRSHEVSEAIALKESIAPESPLVAHGSPDRWALSSNPVESDDPWQGSEGGFAFTHGGEHIDLFMYQTVHGRTLYDVCPNDHSKAETFEKGPHGEPEPCTCWLSRFRDGVMRYGTGYHGWRILCAALQETITFEAIRGQATSQDARTVATWGQRIVDWWAPGVQIGYGNGLPATTPSVTL